MAQPSQPHRGSPTEPVVRPPIPLDELALSQGVAPADNLDAIAARWPADDDPEKLDAFVRSQRAARRSVARDSR
jgi:hypothetical protein